MNWDDEDYQAPTNVKESWDDESEDDEPVVDSWDADSEEEEKPKAAPKPVTKAKPVAKKANKKSTTAGTKTVDLSHLDPASRREVQRKLELDSDLNNAADLFGGLGVADPKAGIKNEPAPILKELPLEANALFHPENKQDFEKLRKKLGPIVAQTSNVSGLHYCNSFAIDFVRDVSKPLSLEQLRKLIATLSLLEKEKIKDERAQRMAKVSATAGKKKAKGRLGISQASLKKDDDKDTTNYDDYSDDDDEFM